jgi:hypothetical protein
MKLVVEKNVLKAVMPMNLFRKVEVSSPTQMLSAFGPIMVLVYQNLEEVFGAIPHAGELQYAKNKVNDLRTMYCPKNYIWQDYYAEMKQAIIDYHLTLNAQYKPNKYLEENFRNIYALFELHESLQDK